MREITLFGEDYAHQQVVGVLVQRLAEEFSIAVQLNWKSVVGGHGRVIRELREYIRELEERGGPYPNAIVVATDANCRGLNERIREMQLPGAVPTQMILAIPDPHIERWLLLDGAAFRSVFGRGCDAPAYKCGRDEYKKLLIEAIHDAGIVPTIGGIESAEDIVKEMDIERAMQADNSLRRFVEELRRAFRQWQQ